MEVSLFSLKTLKSNQQRPSRTAMNAEDDLSRIGISLPKSLLDKFDEILNHRGYSSRSEGIRDAIRTYITYYQWMSDVKGEREGVITMVYDHDQRGLLVTLTDIQHEYHDIIKASIHSHITHDRCLEIILVHGEGDQLKTLTEKLMSQKGVESVKLSTVQIAPAE
jgi:Predicted transcriptional regulators containing the CopG/Arc/MetJ DNA-binding domain and a metal-binding domain